MSTLTSVATGAVVLAVIVVAWAALGCDAETALEYIAENWAAVLLAAEVGGSVLLAACNRYVGAAVLALGALLTIMGVL